MIKRIASLGFDVVVALGALACVLVWFEIRPKDVHVASPPHYVWLLGAIALLLISTWRSFRPSTSKRAQLKLAGVIESEAGQAKWLERQLEEVWHTYNELGVALTHPLSDATLSEVDPIKEYCERELFKFRIAFRGHIGSVKYHLPDFHSEIVDSAKFWKVDYLDLRRKLIEHAAKLGSLANSTENKL